jgi:aminopeptidase-like protein
MSELEIEKYFDRLWPICRSITGNGLRESLKILQELIPLNLTEIPSGAKVFDWEIPQEWNIKDAYLLTPNGKKICDFKVNNLHLVNYSIPVNMEIEYENLLPHLHYIENLPDAIPYITSYYKRTWGFCLTYNDFKSLPVSGTYRVVIDSSLNNGSLTYGDILLEGESEKEILFSTYLCHPSMANNELSGPLVLSLLYKRISQIKNRKYSYRFVVAPETIGIIAYLFKHGMQLKENLSAGYVITCCGDKGDFTYKRSKRGNSLADKIAEHVLSYSGRKFNSENFSVGGSDERQYCSSGFNLPVGSLTRSMYQRYKEYHTSLDNKSFINFSSILESVDMYESFFRALELNALYESEILFCEPNLGKRDLYPNVVNPLADRKKIHNLLHFLSYADGKIDLLEIAEKRGVSIFDFAEIVQTCISKDLIKVKAFV